jgi:hypothetical protein
MLVPKMVNNGQNSVLAFENMLVLGRRAWKLGKFENVLKA